MNWLDNPKMDVQPWQVENLRDVELSAIFERLQAFDIHLSPEIFLEYADQIDSPELLAEALAEEGVDVEVQDQIFLLIFELWRRLAHDKICLSVFADELDWYIHLYDTGQLKEIEGLENALSNLEAVLDENVDQGGDPQEIFQMISEYCANNIEDFLYDFTDAQLDQGNISFASDLIDSFLDYVDDDRWFRLLEARIEEESDPEEAASIFESVVEDLVQDPDLELGMETLEQLQAAGRRNLFRDVVKAILPLLETEADLQDLLCFTEEFYERLDAEQEQELLAHMIEEREHVNPETTVSPEDPIYTTLLQILTASKK